MDGFTKREISFFWNAGYFVAKKMFEVHVCKAALREIKQLMFKPIFRRVYSKKMDEYRRQADIEDLGDAMGFIDGTIKAQVEHAHVDWEVRDGAWHALHSYPGGPDQDPHQDFPAFETAKALLKRQLVQGSVIVALMNGTKMIVYPGCTGGRASMQKRKVLVLQRGDVLFFRGDLAHSGAAYDKENYRLHCYVCIRGIRQKANSTEAVVFDTFRCPKCLVAIDSRGDLTAHKRECENEGDYICGDCGRVFSNRNTRNKHRSRKHLQAVVSDADQVDESDSSNGSRMEVDTGEGDGDESGEGPSGDEEESSEEVSSAGESSEEVSSAGESDEEESSEEESSEESAEEESGEGSSQERDDAESEESEESDMGIDFSSS